MKINYFFLLLFLSSLSSCSFPEHYFTSLPDCTEEKSLVLSPDLLLDKLKNHKSSDFRYKFESFVSRGNETYMLTNFRTDEICFNAMILVDRWDKLAGMRRTNGVSYPKELYDLQWEIVKIEGKETLRYVDMHDIID